MLNLGSHKFSDVTYEKGSEIWFAPDEAGTPFYFDVAEELTGNDVAMATVAFFLDDVDALAEKARLYLRRALADTHRKEHSLVKSFLEFHRDEFDREILCKMLGMDAPEGISLERMIDALTLKRFGSLIDRDSKQQVFIMDLSFDPEYTDELLVLYFDLQKNILLVSHES